jgi:hypothetical protein
MPSSSSAGRGPPQRAGGNEQQQHPSDFDVFCHMAVEEFLMRKNLRGTLEVFRKEWGRPSEEATMVSWYDTALKLRLPELVSNGSQEATVLENLVWALLRESSIKSRRAPDVTVAGLATLPRARPLPALDNSGKVAPSSGAELEWEDPERSRSPSALVLDATATVSNSSRKQPSSSRSKRSQADSAANAHQQTNKSTKAVGLGQSTVHLSDEAAQIVRRQMDEMMTEKSMQARLKNLVKPSSENWIPEITRMRSLERDLAVAKENLADIQLRKMGDNREMKQFRVSDLDRALKAESLGKMHRQSCGCCMLSFLPINLPLKVSQKAILDIRVKWSGGLSSSTVFAIPGQLTIPAAPAAATTTGGPDATAATTAADPVTSSNKQKSFLDKMAERLSVVPRCYDQVPVCFFCAQFFQSSEAYRPSYDRIYYLERKAVHDDTVARNKAYWDPLKMVEKDREATERAELLATPSVSLIEGSSNDLSKEVL